MTVWNQGLFRYDTEADSLIRYPSIGKNNNPFRIYQDNRGQLWICTWGSGIYLFYPDRSETEMYVEIPTFNKERQAFDHTFYSIVQDDKNGYIWTICFSGVHVFEYADDGTLQIVDVPQLFKNYNNVFSEIVKDRDGNLWIGTFSEGVLNINFDKPPVRNYDIPSIKAQTGTAARIMSIYPTENEIWISQDRCGLGIFYPDEDRIELYNGLLAFDVSEINCINGFRSYPGEIWIGNNIAPLIHRMKKEGDRPVLKQTVDLSTIINDPGNAFILYEDRRNNIWICTPSNLFVKPHDSETIQYVNYPFRNLSGITEDTRGELWIGSTSEGVYRIEMSGKTDFNHLRVKNYSRSNGNLASDNVTAVCADKNGKVWIGTREGNILEYNLLTDSVANRNRSMHPVVERILNIIDDDYGNIWISTKKRIAVYNPATGASRDFTENDGMVVNSFLPNSYYKDASGRLFFGGNRGFSMFNPSERLDNSLTQNKVLITDVKINNQSVLQGINNIQFNIQSQYLEINPQDKNIEIDFSSLNYTFPSKIRFAYKLDGIDDNWVYAGGERLFAVYNQLNKGHYKFLVKASDENNVWSVPETVLRIYKRPAFYETAWAYALYTFAVLLLIYYAVVVARKRIQLVNKLKIAQIEKDKSEELAQTKLRYFTNISHDFLTPLTIISCLIDDAEMTNNGKIKQFETIRSNISRLRRLLQQVLDFRKMESGNMKLKITQGDIAGFVKDLCYNHFLTLMKKKNINFLFSSTANQIPAYFDADKIDKIIFNLLSNAFKYTPENGEVKIEMEQFSMPEHKHLGIRISDTGIGIAEEDLNRIFLRFYNNKMKEAGETNGIGLSLTKELVELHHGTISVNSQQGAGTVFSINIPIDCESYSDAELGIADQSMLYEKNMERIGTVENAANSSEETAEQTHILLVEDNEELLVLIQEILSKHYRVTTAGNGVEAIKRIHENEVHIIISDVMMPEMDGLELCRILKTDMETSHIPVILLTAKNSTDDRIDCYNAGGDAYISKPFELKVLEARINNFIANKRNRQKAFRSDFEINISKLEYPSINEQFLKSAVSIIEQHLAEEEDFDVNKMADILNMSKSTLYRKIKSLTGLSPRDFIRNIRLKHACMKLKDKSISISEVAYAVGFSDPKYFSACFKQEFNITPKEYRRTFSII
jgi:signal transduction histidine kinase/DNA-binding response OmpR family regulator/streptogramin lyase